MNASAPGFADSKRHYPVLDGLRGVAALLVVAFHLFEAHAPSRFGQIINHGYLAVDFFFVLSGFVIGYAYDDRWGRMGLLDFCKRRLIRLHPMIVLAMAIGAALYYFQDSPLFPAIHGTPMWKMFAVMAVGMTLLPLPPSMDIRGWGEMHPLNGPAWSLFFEYVANLLYALVVRRFSNTLLGVLVFVSGCVLAHHAVLGPNGDVIGGWSLEAAQLQLGFTRLMYPFFAGLLLSRMVKPGRVRHGFLLSAAMLALVLAMPRIGGPATLWMNGLYETFVIVAVFPLLVWMGAGAEMGPGPAGRLCAFLGGLSYPLYIIHYPFVYTYTAWVADNKVGIARGAPVALASLAACVMLAWACLRFYDIPLRAWLGRRLDRKAPRTLPQTVA
jgi:peptidoglycan/LPS O-acetylase OafA/YrhL